MNKKRANYVSASPIVPIADPAFDGDGVSHLAFYHGFHMPADWAIDIMDHRERRLVIRNDSADVCERA